jgi:hypothetical protein
MVFENNRPAPCFPRSFSAMDGDYITAIPLQLFAIIPLTAHSRKKNNLFIVGITGFVRIFVSGQMRLFHRRQMNRKGRPGARLTDGLNRPVVLQIKP